LAVVALVLDAQPQHFAQNFPRLNSGACIVSGITPHATHRALVLPD